MFDLHTHRAADDGNFHIIHASPEDFVPEAGKWYSVGLHPWTLTGEEPDDTVWDKLEAAVRHPQVLAVGEAGLDKLTTAPLKLQEAVFARQAQLAEEVRKPVVIHLVKAVDELLRVRKQLMPRVPWIIHGFRGKAQLAEALVRHGFYLSFGEKWQAEALRSVPLSCLFLETDESDVPLSELYVRAAAACQLPVEKLDAAVRSNAFRVFGH